ncbi:hypothetical protein ABH926_000118 [Catenulispora sp. GP43]|uniref:hypothetical protein n=1 Tax=Catenulispora sp. GP43 TaxID=3156263 RepID=UPI003516A987
MPEFDDALARAVQDGVGQGGMPGVADAMRRGRKRSLRARGGVAVLGVAAIGGALGVTASLGGPAGAAKTVTAADAPTTTGRPASAPTSSSESAPPPARGDGLLAAKLWPGYDLTHWDPQPSNPSRAAKGAGSLVTHCYPSDSHPPAGIAFPITGMSMWGTEYDTAHHVDAQEVVFTFADEAKASAFLADARNAGSAPACGSGRDALVPAPGVSTGDGVSWLINQQHSSVDNLPSVEHTWVVRVGDRVAMLRVSQFGSDFKSTAGDKKVFADLQAALEK